MKKEEKIDLLAHALDEARVLAYKASDAQKDNGTCNMDSLVIHLKNWRIADIRAVNQRSFVTISEDKMQSTYWKGYRFVRLGNFGQAAKNTVAIEAAYDFLRKACDNIFEKGECSVTVYYMMD